MIHYIISSPEEFVHCDEPEDFSKNSSEAGRLGYGCTKVILTSENMKYLKSLFIQYTMKTQTMFSFSMEVHDTRKSIIPKLSVMFCLELSVMEREHSSNMECLA